jgi:tetratricopeptide (TPR) repeat protein
MYNMACAFIRTGDEFAAVEYFKRAGAADKIGEVAYKSYSRLGIIFTDRGDFEQAQKYLKTCVSLRPNDAIAKYNLGIAYLREGKKDAALDQFVQSEAFSENSQQVLEGLGEAFFVMNQYDKSINVFEKILLTNKRNVKILSRIGEIYYDKGDLDKAYDAFYKITTIEPATENARVAYLNMGNILDDTGRYDEAVEMYKKSLTISPKDDDALYNLGIAYEHSGKPELAIKAWKDSLSLKPDNSKAMIAIANYYFKNGFYDLAEKEYQTILARWPELQECHFKIGNIYYKRNQLDFAFTAFKRSAELDERNEFGRKSLINMALINSERKTDDDSIDESARILKKALILKPDDPNALFAMGVIFSRKQLYEAAIDSFYDTIKASNDDKLSAQAYNDIGKCYFKQKEFSKSVQAFTRGIELDSMNEELRMNRKAASQAFEKALSN